MGINIDIHFYNKDKLLFELNTEQEAQEQFQKIIQDANRRLKGLVYED